MTSQAAETLAYRLAGYRLTKNWTTRQMPPLLISHVTALAAFGAAAVIQPTHASPICVKDRPAFGLAQDTITWTMMIAPGANCIQGLRWSYMQIFDVKVMSGPKNGKLEIVGSGFRYASNDSEGPDKFTLFVTGKNKRTDGTSTIEIDVNPVQSAAQTQPIETTAAPIEANGNPSESTPGIRVANSEASTP